MLGFIEPVDFNIMSATKLEQCSRVIIKCLDNWDNWSNPDELLLGTCTLSSSEDVTVYQFKPVEVTYNKYLLGTNTYVENFCWPGPTPLYSPWDKYPNNFMYANFMAYEDLYTAFKAAYIGLPSNNAAFDGPIQRDSWTNIYKNMSDLITRDLSHYLGL